MKPIILILAAFLQLFYCFRSFSGEVDIGKARKVAVNFYYERVNQYIKTDYDHVNVSGSLTVTGQDIPLYYVFNIEPAGFVIVSASDNTYPVIGYSFKGSYNEYGQPDNFRWWMDMCGKQISESIIKKLPPDNKIKETWDHLLTGEPANLKPYRDEREVLPLLTTEWNQSVYYNSMCPVDAAGPGGHALAGCVATAMGQLMYYHRWPHQGTGSYTYYHDDYGVISADFENTTYKWDEMINDINDENDAIAELLFHIGVSVDMDYGPDGSGMWNHKAAYSFRTYFKYCPETEYVFRDSTTLLWDSILIANLEAKKPLYYAGWDPVVENSGHAFVCDGFQGDDHYHFNWGWGGAYDGYFYTDQLNPGGTDFNAAQELIKDMYPDTSNYTYPEYCNGTATLTSEEGSLTDGSGSDDYINDLDCFWEINPACGSIMEFMFDRFSLETGDTVYIYDGLTTDSPVLGIFTNNEPPVTTEENNPTVISPALNELLINFKTDSGAVAEGWKAAYNVEYCSAAQTLTETSGTVSDGSGPCNYQEDALCTWELEPDGAENIVIGFTEFDLSYFKHYVQLKVGATEIEKYTCDDPPTEPVVIDASEVTVRFSTLQTDGTTGEGWSFDYEINTGIKNNDFVSGNDLRIFPNPVCADTKIMYSLSHPSEISISVIDIFGRSKGTYCVSRDAGNHEILLNTISPDLENGIYSIILKTEHTKIIKKFVKIRP